MESHIVEVKDKDDDIEERKAQLIRQGEFYRAGVVHAKAQVKHAARPEALFHSAVDHATWAVRTRIDNLLKPTGTSVSTLLPYVVTIYNFIRNRRVGKTSLGVAVVLAGVGFYLQQQRAKQTAMYE
jgi:hypothetical protein